MVAVELPDDPFAPLPVVVPLPFVPPLPVFVPLPFFDPPEFGEVLEEPVGFELPVDPPPTGVVPLVVDPLPPWPVPPPPVEDPPNSDTYGSLQVVALTDAGGGAAPAIRLIPAKSSFTRLGGSGE